jgi:two-component system sensor histidine kinase KdpD
MDRALRREQPQPQLRDEERTALPIRYVWRVAWGNAVTIPSASGHIADDVIGYAQSYNVTKSLSANQRDRDGLRSCMDRSCMIVRRSGNISVHVIAGDAIGGGLFKEDLA